MDIEEEIVNIEKAYMVQMTNYSDGNSATIELALRRICQKLIGKSGLEIEKMIDSTVVSNTSEGIAWERIYREIGKAKYFCEKIDCARKAEFMANKMGLDGPVLKIDTFLGGEEMYLELETSAVEKIHRHFDENEYEFIASRRTKPQASQFEGTRIASAPESSAKA